MVGDHRTSSRQHGLLLVAGVHLSLPFLKTGPDLQQRLVVEAVGALKSHGCGLGRAVIFGGSETTRYNHRVVASRKAPQRCGNVNFTVANGARFTHRQGILYEFPTYCRSVGVGQVTVEELVAYGKDGYLHNFKNSKGKEHKPVLTQRRKDAKGKSLFVMTEGPFGALTINLLMFRLKTIQTVVNAKARRRRE
jgi:hypothetical protein